MKPWIACLRGVWLLVSALVTLGVAAPAATAGGAPRLAVRSAVAAAGSHFHTGVVHADFSGVSRRDRSWALVDGTATIRHRLWAAWLHRDRDSKWRVRYLDTTAPFQPQSARRGRVPCDLYPAFSEARCPPGAPGAAHIRSHLAEQLVPHGPGAAIGALLRAGGYSFSFDPPVNGSVVIAWYQARGAHPPAGVSRSAVIARGNADFLRGRPGRITIRLTSAGRRVLGSTASASITSKGTFTPILYAAVSASADFTLRR